MPRVREETGGSVTWQNAGGEIRRPAAKTRKPRPQRVSSGSGFGARIGEMLRPGSEAPVLTWGLAAIAVLLWVVGLFTSLPFLLLAAIPGTEFQIWRFVTSAVVYAPGFLSIIGVALHSLFLALTAPSLERSLGRGRFLILIVTAAIISSAGMLLSGAAAAGLVGVLFAVFGAYLISGLVVSAARTQALVIIGINLLISVALNSRRAPGADRRAARRRRRAVPVPALRRTQDPHGLPDHRGGGGRVHRARDHPRSSVLTGLAF